MGEKGGNDKDKVKGMRSTLLSQHLYTDLLQSVCQRCDFDKIMMVSDTPKKTTPLVTLVHTHGRTVKEVNTSGWKGKEKATIQTPCHASPTLVLSCLCKTGFPMQNMSGKVDGWLLKIRVNVN